MAIAEGALDFVIAQPVGGREMPDAASLGIKAVDAAGCPEVDAPPAILRDTAHAVAGQAIAHGIRPELWPRRGGGIRTADAASVAADPEASATIDKEMAELTGRDTVSRGKEREHPGGETRQSTPGKSDPHVTGRILGEGAGGSEVDVSRGAQSVSRGVTAKGPGRSLPSRHDVLPGGIGPEPDIAPRIFEGVIDPVARQPIACRVHGAWAHAARAAGRRPPAGNRYNPSAVGTHQSPR